MGIPPPSQRLTTEVAKDTEGKRVYGQQSRQSERRGAEEQRSRGIVVGI
jgi:hypothetical protein